MSRCYLRYFPSLPVIYLIFITIFKMRTRPIILKGMTMLLLNQMFMMLWEALLENATLVIVLLLILLVAWGYWVTIGRSRQWKHRLTALSAVVIAVIGFFTLPMFFKSSLANMTYWVDWAFHIAMVIALLIYAYLVLLPLITGILGSAKRHA